MEIIYQPNNDIDVALNLDDLEKFRHNRLEGKIDVLNKRIILDYNISIKQRVIQFGKEICVTLTGEDYDKLCLEKKALSFRYDPEGHRMLIFQQNNS